MSIARFLVGIAALSFTAAAYAQDYPSKQPIRIYAPAAGGGGDFTARQLAAVISGPLGQQVVVENRPSYVLVAEIIAKAPPDGYSISVSGASTWLGPLLRPMVHDVERDFAPVTTTDRAPFLVAVHPSLPVKSIKELIDLAKAKPGALNYSVSSTGGSNHIATELFKSQAGINIVAVPYKGIAPSVTALIAGEVQIAMNEISTVAPHVKSGKLRGLAVTSTDPTPLAPGVPTVAATGLPGYEWVSMSGVFVPVKTPQAIITRLNQEIVRGLNRPEVKERFLTAGVEVSTGTPDQFAATVKSETAKMGKVMKEANIKAD